MFKKFKIALLAATMVLPSVVYASALTAETAAAGYAPVTAAPIYAVGGSLSDSALLENAINAAKQYVGDTDRFASLSHSISDYNGVKVINLYWSDSKTDGESLSAAVGTDGTLYNFSLESGAVNALPVISKADALSTAYAYVIKADASCAAWISKEFAAITYSRWNGYQVAFQSMYNGYAVEGNSITVTVSPEGKVTGFDAFSMARNISVPTAASALISTADAKAALKTLLPLELVYKSFYDYDNGSHEYKAAIKLVYKLADNYSARAVDALTGKLIEVQSNDYYHDGAAQKANAAADGSSSDDKSGLSEAERKEVELQAGMLSAESIDAKLRAVAAFGLTDDYTVLSKTLYSVKSPYDGKLSYQWQFTYINSDDTLNIYATADAKTGAVLSLGNYSGSDYKAASEFKYSEDQCRAAAETLLASLYGDTFKQYVKSDDGGVMPLTKTAAGSAQISSYSFNYVRTVNGVKFPADTVSVTVNPDTLGVFGLNFSYTDTAFPAVSGAMNADAAADKYFSAVTLNPYYMVSLGISDGKLLTPGIVYSTDEKQLTPVYSYVYDGYVDAVSGELLGYDGKSADYKPTVYFNGGASIADLGGSEYADAISALWNMDVITLDGANYEPDRAITAAELEKLLENAGFWYSDGGDKEEAAGSVSIQDALYRVVCALGYSDIAGIDAIYKYPYGDASKVSQGRMGAVAISAALGLLDKITHDGALDPSAALTRGEAAQLAYNLIARDSAPKMVVTPMISAN